MRSKKSSMFRSMRKFCPSLFLGSSPRCSKRSRRKDRVCRGDWLPAVISTHVARLTQGFPGETTLSLSLCSRHRRRPGCGTETFPDVLGKQVSLQVNRGADLFESQGGLC